MSDAQGSFGCEQARGGEGSPATIETPTAATATPAAVVMSAPAATATDAPAVAEMVTPAAEIAAPIAAATEACAARTFDVQMRELEELIAEGRRRREAAAQREALPSTPSRQLQKEVATLCACDENAQQYYDLWDAIEQEERTSVFMTNAERTEHIRARTTKWRTLRARLEPEVAHKIQKAAAAFWSSVPTLRERA